MQRIGSRIKTPKQKAKQMLRYHKSKEKAIKAAEKQFENLCKMPYGLEYLSKVDYLNNVIEEIEKL